MTDLAPDSVGRPRAAVRGRLAIASRRLASSVLAVATALALLGLAIPLFLNPAWVSFEQERSRSDALTGYRPEEVNRITGSLLHDLVVGPPSFDVRDDAGRAVLDDSERSHLRDVRAVMAAALGAFVVSGAVVLASWGVARRRAAFWRGIRAGARLLAGAVLVLGALSLVAFDAMFDLFHRLFFAAGTYSFDPQTERLVQLFPDQFWSETTIALGLVLLALAWDLNRLASRRLARLTPVGASAGGPTATAGFRDAAGAMGR